ncbi:uncharacterized protein G2W53_021839 [Senna tora]|uniref:Uncharacterized protein n=1 Tax=Senna tora TaxID=362788 RepID=A0A834TKX4_9FABA|nr:uncharacterized protein G2W53_021839 [Senna tora]
MVTATGDWNWGYFQHVLQIEVLATIESIKPPHPDDGDDAFTWLPSSDDGRVNWDVFFSIATWLTWKQRNENIFNNSHQVAISLLPKILAHYNELLIANSLKSNGHLLKNSRNGSKVNWIPPEEEFRSPCSFDLPPILQDLFYQNRPQTHLTEA